MDVGPTHAGLTLRDRGLALFAAERYREAQILLARAATDDPQNVSTRVWAAIAARHASPDDAALRALREALAALEDHEEQDALVLPPLAPLDYVEAWSEDGRIVAGRARGSADLVLIHTGLDQPILRLSGESGGISADGRHAMTSDRGRVTRWDVARGMVTHALDIEGGPAVLSPDGESIAVGTRLWRVGHDPLTLPIDESSRFLRFGSASGSLSNEYGYWELDDGSSHAFTPHLGLPVDQGHMITAFSQATEGTVARAHMTMDDWYRFGISEGHDDTGETVIFALKNGERPTRLSTRGHVFALAIAANGRRLMSGGSETRLWQVATQDSKVVDVETPRGEPFWFAPTGDRILALDRDWGVRALHRDGTVSAPRRRPRDAITAIAWGNAHMLAAGTESGAIYRFDLDRGSARRTGVGKAPITALAFDVVGQQLVAGDEEGAIHVLSGSDPPRTRQAHDQTVETVAFTPKGIFSSMRAGEGAMRDPSSLEVVPFTLDDTFGTMTSVDAHGTFLSFVAKAGQDGVSGVAGPDLGAVHLLDLRSGSVKKWPLSNPLRVFALSIADRGKAVARASSSDYWGIELWHVESDTTTWLTPTFYTDYSSFDISPDGKQVLLATKSKEVRVFDTTSGREVGALGGAPPAARHLGHSRDGRIVAAAAGGELWLWRVASQELLARVTVSEGVAGGCAVSPFGHAEELGHGGTCGPCAVGKWFFPIDACATKLRPGWLASVTNGGRP